MTDERLGLEGYFVDHNFYIVSITKKRAEYQQWKYTFEPKQWYFITVTHQFHLLRKSEVTLYVNGQLVESKFLLYPKNPQVWVFSGVIWKLTKMI